MVNKHILVWFFYFCFGSDLLFSQTSVPIESDMISTINGLDVFLDQKKLGITPIEINLRSDKKHLIEFKNDSGEVTHKISIIAKIVSDVGRSDFKPNWYTSPNYALSSHSNYETAVSYDRSRSPNIMFQKALSSAVSNLDSRKSGGRSAPNLPNLSSIESMNIEILECIILYDSQSYGIFIMVGRTK